MMVHAKQGKIIAIEGTDGTGKRTQTDLLVRRLMNEGVKTSTYSFPQYGKKSAGLTEEYLNNRYGPAVDVNPYAASLFYALDRFDASVKIRSLKDQGHWIILDRYVDSNAGHQGSKINNEKEREEFLTWLYGMEYQILGVPRPDIVFVLYMPAEKAVELNAKKEKRAYIEGAGNRDGHDGNIDHLKSAEKTYLWLANKHHATHKIIECIEDDRLLEPQEIHERVWSHLSF
jgi:dTMP kinase